jgi:hypothetical protein
MVPKKPSKSNELDDKPSDSGGNTVKLTGLQKIVVLAVGLVISANITVTLQLPDRISKMETAYTVKTLELKGESALLRQEVAHLREEITRRMKDRFTGAEGEQMEARFSAELRIRDGRIDSTEARVNRLEEREPK